MPSPRRPATGQARDTEAGEGASILTKKRSNTVIEHKGRKLKAMNKIKAGRNRIPPEIDTNANARSVQYHNITFNSSH